MSAQSKVFGSTSNAQILNSERGVGYLIGEQGQALKITEAMIKRACMELKSRCQFPATEKH